MNLVVNARDAMPDGGDLIIETVSVYLDSASSTEKPGTLPGQYIMFSVTDTGFGMDSETVTRVFEPFFTTKPSDKGTGLGLATTYGIIKQHGGNIWVYSEPGHGTTFKVYLPQITEQQLDHFDKPQRAKPITGTETIMVVEDESVVRKLACRILTDNGFNVIETASAEDAVKKAKEFNQIIHLLLTDVIMPLINGPEIYRQIRQNHPDMLVLYMSGYSDEVITSRGILKEGVQFLQKPFSKKSLLEKITHVLSRDR